MKGQDCFCTYCPTASCKIKQYNNCEVYWKHCWAGGGGGGGGLLRDYIDNPAEGWLKSINELNSH